MQDKIIPQLLESFAGLPIPPAESLELALQILAWAKLSNSLDIPEELRLDTALINEPDRLLSVLQQLGKGNGLVHQAFPGSSGLLRHDPIKLRPALSLALRLNNTGLLQNFEPIAAITSAASQLKGEMLLPEDVADLMTGLTAVRPGESVYTPWDAWGHLSSKMAYAGSEVYLETPTPSAIPALTSLLSAQPFQVHYADPICSPSAVEMGKPRLFNVAVALPPLGMKLSLDVVTKDWYSRFPEKTTSGTVLAIRHLLCQAQRRVVVAVMNSVLFSPGAERSLREDLLSHGNIESIIALPAGLFAGTNIALSILVLNPAGGVGKIHFVNADTPRFCSPVSKARCQLINLDQLLSEIRKGATSDEMVLVDASDVLKNDAQLQVSRYVLPDSQKQLQAKLGQAHTVELGDLVSTVRPMLISKREEGEVIEVMEVGVADLPPYGFIQSPEREVKVPRNVAAKSERQFLRPLDIVLIIKGSVGKVGIVPLDVPPPGPRGWVAGQSAIVLRASAKSNVDARALAVLLRSALGQELLNGIVSGASSIKLIQLRELERLQVLVADAETNHRAVEALEKEAVLQKEIERLREEQAKSAADLWTLT